MRDPTTYKRISMGIKPTTDPFKLLMGIALTTEVLMNSDTFVTYAEILFDLYTGRCPRCGYLFRKRAYGCEYKIHIKYPEIMSQHGC